MNKLGVAIAATVSLLAGSMSIGAPKAPGHRHQEATSQPAGRHKLHAGTSKGSHRNALVAGSSAKKGLGKAAIGGKKLARAHSHRQRIRAMKAGHRHAAHTTNVTGAQGS